MAEKITFKSGELFKGSKAKESITVDGVELKVGGFYPDEFGLAYGLREGEKRSVHRVTKSLAIITYGEIKNEIASAVSGDGEYFFENGKYEWIYNEESHTFTSPKPQNSPQARSFGLSMAAYITMPPAAKEAFEEISDDINKQAAYFCDYVYFLFAKDKTFESEEVSEAEFNTMKTAKFSVEAKAPEDIAAEIEKPEKKTRKKAEKAETGNEAEDEMAVIKSGKYFIDYDWDPESQEHIPSIGILDSFVPTPDFFYLLNKFRYRLTKIKERMDAGETDMTKILGKDYLNVSLVGEPGSGKTTMMRAIAAALHMPFCSENIHPNTEDDTFEGKNKMVDGHLQFVKTEFLNGFTKGWMILMDEVNFADPATIAMLNDSIIAPYTIKENGYLKRERHPFCAIVTAHNVDTAGTKDINEAFDRRLMYTKVVKAPTDEEFIKFLTLYHPLKPSKWVYEVYKRVKNHLKEAEAEDISRAIAIDACDAALNDIEEGRPPYIVAPVPVHSWSVVG